MKTALHVAPSSPNLWVVECDGLQAWTLSTLLSRVRPTRACTRSPWLRNKVGLTKLDMVARFAPFVYRSFDADTLSSPRVSHLTLAPERRPQVFLMIALRLWG